MKPCKLIVSHSVMKRGNHVKLPGGLAHRIVYECTYGKIPEGKIVRHKCDNGNCIEPTHLELGTQAENMNDKVRRGRIRTARFDCEGRLRIKAGGKRITICRHPSSFHQQTTERAP